MIQLIQGLLDKIKILETKEDQDRQENAAMRQEIQHLQKKVSTLVEYTESKEKPHTCSIREIGKKVPYKVRRVPRKRHRSRCYRLDLRDERTHQRNDIKRQTH